MPQCLVESLQNGYTIYIISCLLLELLIQQGKAPPKKVIVKKVESQNPNGTCP